MELIAYLGYVFWSDDVLNKESSHKLKVSYACIDQLTEVFDKLSDDVKNILSTLKFGGTTLGEILSSTTNTCIHLVGLSCFKYYLSAYTACKKLGAFDIVNSDAGTRTRIKAWYDKADWKQVTQLVPFLIKLKKPPGMAPTLDYIKYVMAVKVDHKADSSSINEAYFLTGFYKNSNGEIDYLQIGLVKGTAFHECFMGQTFDRSFIRRDKKQYPLTYTFDPKRHRDTMHLAMARMAFMQLQKDSDKLLSEVIRRAHSFHNLRVQTFKAYADFTVKMIQLHATDIVNTEVDTYDVVDTAGGHLQKLGKFIIKNPTMEDPIMMDEYSIVPKYLVITDPDKFNSGTKNDDLKALVYPIQIITSLEYVKGDATDVDVPYKAEIRDPFKQTNITKAYRDAKSIAKICAYDEFNGVVDLPLEDVYSLLESYAVKLGCKLDFLIIGLYVSEHGDGNGEFGMLPAIKSWSPSLTNIESCIKRLETLLPHPDIYSEEADFISDRFYFLVKMVEYYFKYEARNVDQMFYEYSYTQFPITGRPGSRTCMHQLLNGLVHEGALSPDTMLFHFTEMSKEAVLLMEIHSRLEKLNKCEIYTKFYTWHDVYFYAILDVLQDIFQYDPPVAPITKNRVPMMQRNNEGLVTQDEQDTYNSEFAKFDNDYKTKDAATYNNMYVQEYKRLAQTYAIKLFLAPRHSILANNFVNCMTNMLKNMNGPHKPFQNPGNKKSLSIDYYENTLAHVIESGFDLSDFINETFTDNSQAGHWDAVPGPGQ